MILANVNNGQRVHLLAVKAGRKLQMRLAAMGLVPGVEIEMVCNSQWGPFIIAVKGSRMVLGSQIAKKIAVA